VAVPDHDPVRFAGDGVGDVGDDGDEEAGEDPPPLQPVAPTAMRIAATVRAREQRGRIMVKLGGF